MKLQLPGKKTRYWQVFWLCLLAAAALFAPHCLVDAVAGGGYFHYAGDFNDQQINFYQYANSFISRGAASVGLPIISLIHLSEPTKQAENSYSVFCFEKKKKKKKK